MEHEAVVDDVGMAVGEEGVSAGVVLLEARSELIPIFVSPAQLQSIEIARRDRPPERPGTHDLLIEMITDFDATITRVRIDDLVDDTFYAKIDAGHADDDTHQKFVFDARPSDGIALAIRADCPITITDDVIDEAGHPPEEFSDHDLDIDLDDLA